MDDKTVKEEGGAAEGEEPVVEEEGAEGAEGVEEDGLDDDDGDEEADVKADGKAGGTAAGSAKRSLRPRGSGRGGKKPKGNAEKHPVMQYREGEPLRDLRKYLGEGQEDGQLVEVRIPAASVTSANRQVRARQLWGTDVYTDDSDLVAVLMHTGFYLPTAAQPPPAIVELHATVRPLPPQDGYDSKARNSIRSRAWGFAARSGCSFRVEGCKALTPTGATVELDASLARAPAAVPTFVQSPEARQLNTRASAASSERRQRFVQEVTVQYNLCNEPWLKYSMSVVADRGLNHSQLTSARLRKEVLMLETHAHRYELSCDQCGRVGDSDAGPEEDTYRWVKARKPYTLATLTTLGLPLPDSEVEPMFAKLQWEELRWSNAGVQVQGKAFPIVRLQFMPRRKAIKPL